MRRKYQVEINRIESSICMPICVSSTVFSAELCCRQFIKLKTKTINYKYYKHNTDNNVNKLILVLFFLKCTLFRDVFLFLFLFLFFFGLSVYLLEFDELQTNFPFRPFTVAWAKSKKVYQLSRSFLLRTKFGDEIAYNNLPSYLVQWISHDWKRESNWLNC